MKTPLSFSRAAVLALIFAFGMIAGNGRAQNSNTYTEPPPTPLANFTVAPYTGMFPWWVRRSPAPTATPTATPTPSATPTATPTPTPSPTATPTLAKPHGIIALMPSGSNLPLASATDNWVTNPSVDGVAIRLTWGGTGGIEEAADGTYDWSLPDSYVDLAAAHGKEIEVYFAIGTLPHWCTSTVVDGFPVPWVNPCHDKWIAAIQAVGARYNGAVKPRLTTIVMGGLGGGGNTLITTNPTDIATLNATCDSAGNCGLAAWEKAGLDFAAAWQAACPYTVLALSIKGPYGDSNSAANAVLSDLCAQLGAMSSQFGFENVDLAYTTNSGSGLPDQIIHSYSSTNYVGYQLRDNSAGTLGPGLGCPTGTASVDCLQAVIETGERIGAHAVQPYNTDTSNAAYAAMFATESAAMAHWGQ